jgi:hypothetical protein
LELMAAASFPKDFRGNGLERIRTFAESITLGRVAAEGKADGLSLPMTRRESYLPAGGGLQMSLATRRASCSRVPKG